MEMLAILQQMLVLLILMGIGFVASRRGIITKEGEGTLSRFVVNIASPSLIVSSVTSSERLSDNRLIFVTFGIAIVYFVLMPVAAKLLNQILRVPAEERDQYELSLVFSNIGFMGIPVVNAIFGAQAILYVSIFMAIYNVSIYTYGYLRLQTGEGRGGVPIGRILNIGTISAVFAIVCYLLELRLPAVIFRPLELTGGTTTPLAMIIIGAMLTKYRLLDVIGEARIWVYTVLKLLVLPTGIFFLCRLCIQDAYLVGVITIIAGMPVGSMLNMICRELGHDSRILERITALTTVLSVLSIPVLTLLF